MTTDTSPDGAVPRREQRRRQTLAEITTTARTLLVRDGVVGVTLRAIAREMGMTAPALYRYFESHEDVVTALTAQLYDELVAHLESARDAVPEADAGARLLAAGRAFREWAVANRAEFGLVFANPITGFSGETDNACDEAGRRFGAVFGVLFNQLWASRPFDVPDISDLDPGLVAELETWDDEVRGDLPIGAVYVYLRCWANLYGTVALEVFGHLGWALADTEPMFEDMLAENARMLGIE